MSNYKTIYDYAERPPIAEKIRKMASAQLYDYLLDMASATLMDEVPSAVGTYGYGPWRLSVERLDNPVPGAPPSDWVFVSNSHDVRVELRRGGKMTMRSSATDTPTYRLQYIPVAHVMFAFVSELNTEMFPVLYDHEGNTVVRSRISNSNVNVMVDLNDMQVKPISNMGYTLGAWERDSTTTPWRPPSKRGHYYNPDPLAYSFIETKERNKVRAIVKELVQYAQMLAAVEDIHPATIRRADVERYDGMLCSAVRDMLRGETLLDAIERHGLDLTAMLYPVCTLLGVSHSTGGLRSVDVAKLKYEKFDGLAVDVAGVRKKFDRLYLTNPTLPLAKWREVLPSIR
jgi:hypothetical protein